MFTFLFWLAWAIMISVYFVLLVRIAARPVPHPSDLSRCCDGVVLLRNRGGGPRIKLRGADCIRGSRLLQAAFFPRLTLAPSGALSRCDLATSRH